MTDHDLSARPLRLGTRRSALALWQANFIRDQLRAHWGESLAIELVEIVTKGDIILDRPLALVGGKGLFVNGIEERLLDNRIDFAVHSMKDLPSSIPDGLRIQAIPERADPRDALVGPAGVELADLPAGTRVGTSSLRRSALTLRANPEVEVVSIRGNVPTRIGKIEKGECDAVLLAAAGLDRLGLAEHIQERLDPATFIPAATQGILAIECREADAFVCDVLDPLNHAPSVQMAAVERAFLTRLDGGCQVPMGCFAQVEGERLMAHGMIGDPSGRPVFEARANRPHDVDLAGARALGIEVAEALLEMGAGKVIERLVAAKAHGS